MIALELHVILGVISVLHDMQVSEQKKKVQLVLYMYTCNIRVGARADPMHHRLKVDLILSYDLRRLLSLILPIHVHVDRLTSSLHVPHFQSLSACVWLERRSVHVKRFLTISRNGN